MVASITSIIPSIVAGTAFCTRRTDRGLHANHPVVGAANLTVAAGQSYKAFENSVSLAEHTRNTLTERFKGASEMIRKLSKGDKFVSGFDKFLKLVGDTVNYWITIASALKVIFADDKETAAYQELLGLSTMFAFESGAKNFLGMSRFERINGKSIAHQRKALYKEVKVVKNAVEKFVNYCNNTKVCGKSIKYLPSVLKGLAFVGASIIGYKLGSSAGTSIANSIKERRNNKAKCVELNTNHTNNQNKTATEVAMQPYLLAQTQSRKTA